MHADILSYKGANHRFTQMLRQLKRLLADKVKILAGWLIFRSGLYRRMLRDRAVIVVFHRVNDAYHSDPLTTSRADFGKFVRFFARYFDVISLSALLARLAAGADIGSALTITFDDGYWGNATIAAPILERHGLRACFFVTTGWIGTNHIPWWDQEKSIKTEWMTWDLVRGLHAAGHEVGSHTTSHVNLGLVVGEGARNEIGGGNARLVAELGESAGLFAYPYGGRQHLAEANKCIPKELGLRCNLSAYGGTVSPGDDPFSLRRTAITNWFSSPYSFGFELVTGRVEPT